MDDYVIMIFTKIWSILFKNLKEENQQELIMCLHLLRVSYKDVCKCNYAR